MPKRNGCHVKTKVGSYPKSDPAIFRYSINFNIVEHAAFLVRFEESGMKVKVHFIKTCIFDKPSFHQMKSERFYLLDSLHQYRRFL